MLISTSCPDRKHHSEHSTSQMNRKITSYRVTANRDCLQMTSSTVTARRTTSPYLKIPFLIPGCWDQNPEKQKWWRFIPAHSSELCFCFQYIIYCFVLFCVVHLSEIHRFIWNMKVKGIVWPKIKILSLMTHSRHSKPVKPASNTD